MACLAFEAGMARASAVGATESASAAPIWARCARGGGGDSSAHPRSALRVHPRARARHLAALDAFEAGMALARAGELARNARTVHIYAHLLCEQSVLRCVTALVIDPHPSGLVDFAGRAA